MQYYLVSDYYIHEVENSTLQECIDYLKPKLVYTLDTETTAKPE